MASMFILIHESLSPNAPKLEYKSVDNTLKVNSRGEAFVDDTGLGCTSNDISEGGTDTHPLQREEQDALQNLTRLAQE